DDDLIREVGLFDTLGYRSYPSSVELAKFLKGVADTRPLPFDANAINVKAPVYVVQQGAATDYKVKITSRLKKAGLRYRSFDPTEQGRMSASDAIANVAASHGIIVPFLGLSSTEAAAHNIRAAFVAGLGYGMEKVTLLIQQGDDPVPLDYRDLVKSARSLDQIDGFIGEFAPVIMDLLQAGTDSVLTAKASFLERLSLGASTAENEMGNLGDYYLETAEFRRAYRGEGQIVTGRKGSGKTAIFVQVRDKLRRVKHTVVLDLKPEGYQLLKFKDVVLTQMEQGTKEHTITAFWEYLLLLETCHRILENDRDLHLRNHDLTEPYKDLQKEYEGDDFISEGDFAERVLLLTQRIEQDFQAIEPADNAAQQRLSREQITNAIYKHDTRKLRDKVAAYLENKNGLWVLVDNLDKGWPAHGLAADDLMILRCLLEAISKMQKYLQRKQVDCHGIIFLRNDIYELLLANTPDRGKYSRIAIDWSDGDLLREMLRKRLAAGDVKGDPEFDRIWREIAVSHVAGEESSAYLIDRCLMRPRFLLDLVNACKSHAINMGHSKIDENDIHKGEENYSSDLVANIGFEIRDVHPVAEDVLYAFVDVPSRLSADELDKLLTEKVGIKGEDLPTVVNVLLWYGVLGLVKPDGEVVYISSVRYDQKLLRAFIQKAAVGRPMYHINPAFWTGLSIRRANR
ncbi:MAG TPA: hypothetical protein VGF55_34440, partial [Gemmataceae bacterium]